MQKILRIFSKEYANINQAALLLGCFTFLSQILALFRDRFIAHFIGPSAGLDAYYAAFRVPDLIFISIASLASVTVLIPFIIEKMPARQSTTGGNGETVTAEARKLMNDIFTIFLIVMVMVSFVAFLIMPYLVSFIAPGFSANNAGKSSSIFTNNVAFSDFNGTFKSFLERLLSFFVNFLFIL